jgi:hypothetical protein
MNPQSFVEQIQFSTLRLELVDDAGQPKGIGTGFLVKADLRNNPGSAVILLVSNKHVFEGSKGFVVAFHKRKPSLNEPDLGQIYRFQAKDYSGAYFAHLNPNVDLACVNISTVIEQLHAQIYYKFLDQSLFANFSEPDLDAGQRVIFVGYPDNRYDQVHNLPIIRSGVIASHPKVDFNGEPQFIIDAQVFPGSSGSPVFLNVKEAQFNRGQIILGGGQSPYIFIGVVSATMIRNNVVNFVPTQFVPLSQEVIGLGLVFKSTALADLIETVVNHYSGPK